MKFSQGQTVVHPHHGPSTVIEITTRPVRGIPMTYLRLQVQGSALEIGVPLDRADDVGLRPLLDDEQRARLLAVLGGPGEAQEAAWSRRYKATQDRLRVGDLLVTAGVVRDLTRRLHAHGLSLGERDQLREARALIVAEASVALALPHEEAEHRLDEAILGRVATAS